MDEEEQPLLDCDINYVEPVADDQSFIVRHPSRLSVTWRQAKRLDTPISNWFLYPAFWLCLWVLLQIQNLQGVLYTSPCKMCRKKSGTVDQLTAASDDGCPHCTLYAEALATMATQIQKDLGMLTLKSELLLKKFPIKLKVWNVGGFETITFRFLAPRVIKEEGASVYPGSFTIPEGAASEETMKFATASFEECIKSHKVCRTPKVAALPKRVVDVCNFNPKSDVKLYESHGKKAKYIALSHTWGQKHTFMTKESNIAERKRGIRLDSLPNTFKDAVLMARRLRVRYIWIDSLCIMQDNLADWEEESPKMGTIYGNAYLTIAAGSAINDQSGFLGFRSDLMYRDFSLRIRIGECVAASRVQDLTAPDRRDPLSFRAWAFQERLLSRRTLYYHQQELVYECRQGTKCECMSCSRVIAKDRTLLSVSSPSPSWTRLGVTPAAQSFPRVEIPHALNPDLKDDDLRHFWQSYVVPEYSARSISRDTDCLPALSSVAAAVHALAKNDRYLAGMWYRSLPSDLAWTTVRNARSRSGERVLVTLPATYVAPSWCWASINGAVEYRNPFSSAVDDEKITYKISLLAAECSGAAAGNPFGSVSSGLLTLSGIVLYGTCERRVEPDKLWPYRVRLLFPTPGQMTLGFEADLAFLGETDAFVDRDSRLASMDVDEGSSHRMPPPPPDEWRDIGKTLKRKTAPATVSFSPVASSSSSSSSYGGDPLPDTFSSHDEGGSLPYGRIQCLLLYTKFQPGRCEWIFMVLGRSKQNEGMHERLGMLTCWVNGDVDREWWPEIEGLATQVITVI